jgi:hypothetical protein
MDIRLPYRRTRFVNRSNRLGRTIVLAFEENDMASQPPRPAEPGPDSPIPGFPADAPIDDPVPTPTDPIPPTPSDPVLG